MDTHRQWHQHVAVETFGSLVRRMGARLLGSSPLSALRLRRIAAADPLVILNLHRVAPHDGSAFPPLAPHLFDELLGFVTRRFSVIGFSDLGEKRPRPRLILSFDDGYRDFAEYAMPLLAKHRLRANQNIVPSCAQSGLPPLQVLAADFLGRAPEELVARLAVPGFDVGPRRGRWRQLDAYLRSLIHSEQKQLADILVPKMLAWEEFRPAAMLSPAEIAQVAAEHDIGGHSFDHASMANESDGYLMKDVERCRVWIASVTGRPMRIYAFPNGSCRPDQPEAVRAAGVDHVLLTGGGFGGSGGIHDRIGVSAASRSEVRFRALGARAPLPPGGSAA